MKKFLCLLLILVVLASTTVIVSAVKVEKEQYTIELPDSFTEVGESKFIGDKNENLSVNIEEKQKLTVCVADMSQKEAERYASTIAELSQSAFEVAGRQGSMEVIGAEVKDHPDGRRVFVATYKTMSADSGKETVFYQRIYEFSCVNNQYTFVLTTESVKELDEFQSAFDSITITEAEDKGFKGDIGAYVIVAVLFGLFGWGIVRFIRTPAKRKAGKLKNKK